MAYYRLYFMDGVGSHVTNFVEIDADSETDAIARAEERRGRVAMELWCGRKKVMHWPAGPSVKSSPAR